MNNRQIRATVFALLAALLYAINAPVSKLLLEKVPAVMMAAFLYFGAGLGLFIVSVIQKLSGKKDREQPLTKKELPYTIAMVVLDIAAPIFLMLGLKFTTAANVSLLNNFEIAATSIIALFVFKEAVSKRLWCAIGLVTLSSFILSFEDMSSFSFSTGSLFVLAACVCWGFENNCTRMLSSKNPLEIVVIKGFGSGFGSFVIALITGEKIPGILYILCALLLGFVAYGLSICFYI
ncbi:MAG: DMT family transporter, partial [Acutalibacteraceae bacterium]